MDLLLAVVFGVALGLIAHYALPHRGSRGVVLLPAVGAVVGSAVWVGMTWAGATTTDPWIWVLSIAAPTAAVIVVGVVLARVRAVRDARERRRLGIA